MKKMIRVGLIAAVAVFVGILGAPASSAQTTTPTTTTTTTPTTRSQSIRCSITQARLNTRIARVDTVKQSQTELYTGLQTRVDKLITSADSAGYDIAELTQAQTALKEKITTYTTAATVYTTALMATKNLSCGESDGAFATSLLESRESLLDIRLAALDVRKTFREEVVPALKSYATWLKNNTTSQNEVR